MRRVVTLVENALAAVLLVSQLAVAQPVIVVRNVQFAGELGLPEKDLQENTEFLKGHPLEESKVLKQSAHAIRNALGHRGFESRGYAHYPWCTRIRRDWQR